MNRPLVPIKAVTSAGLFLALTFVTCVCASDVEVPKQSKTREESARYREAAWAHFQKRCTQDARETIHRVVENVEAILLLKPRRKPSELDLADQHWMGDPYGYSSYEANHPVATYLFDRSGKTLSGRVLTPIKGYRHVELSNPKYQEGSGQSRYLRYKLESVVVLNSVTKKPENKIQPRPAEVDVLLSGYGVTWDDISTKEDRRYWVAGGRLAIIDLRTQELIGERIGYVIDPEFGSDHQGRRPWLAVGFSQNAFCPKFENRFDRNKEFVAKVLKARVGRNGGQ